MGAFSLGTAALLLSLSSVAAVEAASSAAAVSVVCRTQFHPVGEHVFGVPTTGVRLAWYAKSTATAPPQHPRAEVQVAYEVEVQSAGGEGKPLFSTGKTASAEQQLVLPASVVLAPDTTYSWRVRTWLSGSSGSPSEWGCGTPAAKFDTAPAASVFPSKAAWIGGGGQLRATKGLSLPAGKVARARVWVSGMGAFYLYINGEKVGINVMDPPQTVYSRTILFSTFDAAALLKPGQTNDIGALLGNYKWGYTDQWVNMTKAGGPTGTRALVLKLSVTMADGSTHTLDTSQPSEWQARVGPVIWDHFFHGETFDASLPPEWDGVPQPSTSGVAAAPGQSWQPAVVIAPSATAPTGMQVLGPDGAAVALGELKPTLAPPLRVTGIFPAVSVAPVHAADVGTAWVFDFAQNMAGMTQLLLPAGHGIPKGTALRIEHGEVAQGKSLDIDGMCALCPGCAPCSHGGGGGGASGPSGAGSCDTRGIGAVCDTYCNNPGLSKAGANDHPLRSEPCFPHQSYSPGFPNPGVPAHETPDRYIGDFNNANMTNVYIVRGDGQPENYTALFAGAGFRYAQLSGLPAGHTATKSMLRGLRVHSNIGPSGSLTLPPMVGSSLGTHDVLTKIHEMTRASQTSNLWSIPTDCPQRERRGWMGDAQASADEALGNFDMQTFYEEFLNKIRDDQLRFDGNHNDTGALADVVPFDGIGGNPGCPVWQVAYIVIARQMWKHHGEDVLPSLRTHWPGLLDLMGWFDRHADPADGLLVTKCYGDWMGFKPESGNGGGSLLTPAPAVTAFYHVLAMKYLGEIAGALGDPSEAAWLAKHAHGQKAYHKRFYDPEAGGYSPCEPPPAPPPAEPKLKCKPGSHIDAVALDGDNGSCKCTEFCASDWSGRLAALRPHWTGATSLFTNTLHDRHTPCQCVQATHFCNKSIGGGCETICREAGVPTAADYCMPGSPPPNTGGKCHGTSAHGSQTSNSIALALGAPPDKATAQRVAKNLAEDVRTFGNKTTTGVVGIAFLFPALDAAGYSDVVLDTLLNDAYPSLGHMAHQNMTTLCENWACTFHEAGGGSQNHIMLGGWDAWLLSSVGGLDSAVNGSTGGWADIIVRVAPAAITTLRKASYKKLTRFGEVSLDWRFEAGKFTSTLSLPVGTRATVHTPSVLREGGVDYGVRSITEGAQLLWARDSTSSSALEVGGVFSVQQAAAAVLTEVGSGSYLFEAQYA